MNPPLQVLSPPLAHWSPAPGFTRSTRIAPVHGLLHGREQLGHGRRGGGSKEEARENPRSYSRRRSRITADCGSLRQ